MKFKLKFDVTFTIIFVIKEYLCNDMGRSREFRKNSWSIGFGYFDGYLKEEKSS